MISNKINIILSLVFLTRLIAITLAGWSYNKNKNNYKSEVFSINREWLYESSSIGIKLEGCVWGYVGEYSDDMGCMENESEDGTTMWYMMANCRRAQVAYSVYTTNSGSTSCNNKDFRETFVTKTGLSEFAYTLGNYGYNSPISEDEVSDLPICEQDDYGYYLSVGCSSAGTFTIDRFLDEYCMQYYDTYDSLSNLNYSMKSLSKCYNCYDSYQDGDVNYSLCAYLIPYSGSCSTIDSFLCTTNNFVKAYGSSKSLKSKQRNVGKSLNTDFGNKLKFSMGVFMLFCSLAMFVGILFTNRRKRIALMHRKFSQSLKKKSLRIHKNKNKSSSRNISRLKMSHENVSGILT